MSNIFIISFSVTNILYYKLYIFFFSIFLIIKNDKANILNYQKKVSNNQKNNLNTFGNN